MNELLTSMPLPFQKKVMEVIGDGQIEVLLKLLEIAESKDEIMEKRALLEFVSEWHNQHKKHPYLQNVGCGCVYCRLTNKYANLKLTVHRTRKRLDNYFALYPSPTLQMEESRLSNLESELHALIKIRKEMKADIAIKKQF